MLTLFHGGVDPVATNGEVSPDLRVRWVVGWTALEEHDDVVDSRAERQGLGANGKSARGHVGSQRDCTWILGLAGSRVINDGMRQ
jgi:hypothetical protein